MPIGTQVKLLRVLESGEFTRLGTSHKKKVDVRVIAATNRVLEDEITNGNFRQDLFFRLKSVHILLPALREHAEDIPLLVDYFAKRTAKNNKLQYEGISDEAMRILQSLPWHGNIRELRNLIETMMILEEISFITATDVKQYIPPALSAPKTNEQPKEQSLVPYKSMDDPEKFELQIIFRTLLELKNDTTDIKGFLYNLNMNYEDIREEMKTIRLKTSPAIPHTEDITVIDDNDLRLDVMEKKLIAYAIEKFEGNRRKASESLGISERTLYRKLSDYGLNE